MRSPFPSISMSVLTLAIASELALAQTPPPAPDAKTAGPTAAVYDPQQLPALRGEVQQFTLTGRGDIDGFVLKDGTEVKTPPELSTQLAFVLKPGSHVTIHGLRAAAVPLVRAMSVTDDATRRTVTEDDTGAPLEPRPRRAPPPPEGPLGRPPAPAQGALSEQSGRVRMALHGPQGEVNGVLLESGAIWRFPPDEADHSPKTKDGAHPVHKLNAITKISGKPFKSNGGPQPVRGVVAAVHYARHGEPNGVILESGEFIHTRPDGMKKLKLEIGSKVVARGEMRMTVFGTPLIEAREVNRVSIE